jgi:DNA-binding MarR family transcriptional regulator
VTTESRSAEDPRPAEPLTPADEVARAFKGVFAAVRRMKGRETHRPGELSYAQYHLLFGLADGPPRSARELAELADLAPATVTQMLDHLADAGLVVRLRSDVDKRIVLTSLTRRGRAVVDKRRGQMEPRWREALSEFSDSELHTAAAVLDRLRELFDELLDRPT